jgi:putative restriction endonuclease
MKMYVGVTDRKWFQFLAQRAPDEVNFWRPGGNTAFRALEPNAPFLFKLHRPQSYIVGGGFFVSYSALPLSLAWSSFGEKNGVQDLVSFSEHIYRYRGRGVPREPDPTIGCIILTAPFFFAEQDWIPEPSDWSPNLVQGRTYDTSEPIGANLWQQVEDRLSRMMSPSTGARKGIAEVPARYGAPYLATPRLGQGAFRVLVTDAYTRRCAITGERTLPVLQASHIKPFAKDGPNLVNNGLLLRSDLHILFDRGYMTVNPELRVEVSPRIREEFSNGREYYALHGKPLVATPSNILDRPSDEFLDWHNQNVFVR